MQEHVLREIDPGLLGRRLRDARKARGLTQHEVSESLEVARTTITSLEKGQRRIRPDELIQLARLYGRQVGTLVGSRQVTEDFTAQFRVAVANEATSQNAAELEQVVHRFRRLCEDYLQLEKINGMPLPRNYPREYSINRIGPEDAAEDVAASERNRLGLGDGPVLNLQETLENDVGIRIFRIDLPSSVSGIFGYTEEIGACIAVNSRHPETRRRWSLAHEYGHFLTGRFQPDISRVSSYRRIPASERFADSFARSLLMPATGLRRRFHQISQGSEGRVTPADVCRVAHFYFVSVEAMMLRLEELRLVPKGTWELLRERGFKVQEAFDQLGLSPSPHFTEPFSFRFCFLAVRAFADAHITEGELAHLLGVARVVARRIVQQFMPALFLSVEEEPEPTVNLTNSIRRVYSEVDQYL